MADGPDPLGKRALYWMPIDQQKVSDIDPDPLVGQSRGSSTHPTPARSHAAAGRQTCAVLRGHS